MNEDLKDTGSIDFQELFKKHGVSVEKDFDIKKQDLSTIFPKQPQINMDQNKLVMQVMLDKQIVDNLKRMLDNAYDFIDVIYTYVKDISQTRNIDDIDNLVKELEEWSKKNNN